MPASHYPTRKLGKTGVQVSASMYPFENICVDKTVGFGAMGMSAFYGPTKTEEENFKVLTRAADLGVTFWDTADVYGFGHNEGIIALVPLLFSFIIDPGEGGLMDLLCGCGEVGPWHGADLWVEMIGKWFKKTGRRNEIFLCTKFANTLDGKFNVRGDPEYVKSACRDSLKRLDIEQIDLFYMHR